MEYLSTPVFSWPQPADRDTAVPWSLVVRQSGGSVVATRSTASPRVLLSDVVLPGGAYEWTVSYTSKSGVATTSQPRRFVIPSASSALTQIPSGNSYAAAMQAKAHPRMLPAGASAASIVDAATGGEYSASFANFLSQAATLAAQAPAPVPKNLGPADFATSTDYYGWLQQVALQATNEHQAIENLGYAGWFTGNSTYTTAAINRLLSLAAWPVDGATSESVQDQANREIYVALGLGLDLFKGRLSAPQRSAIVASLKARLSQVLVKVPDLDASPYDSHMLTAVHYVMEALSYAAGTPEFPEATGQLASAWETWVTTLGSWGGSDGGFGNSTAYAWYALHYLAPAVASVKAMSGLDLSRWPVIGRFADTQIAFTPPVAAFRGQFGDEVETTTSYTAYSYTDVRLYASAMRMPALEWYWRAYAPNVSSRGAVAPVHYLMLGIPGAAATPAAPTENSKLLEDAGLVAMHSSASDPGRTSVFFRSSRLGSYNHSHADNNAFTFVSKGQPLLVSGGYYPYYGSPHHLAVGRATRFKNALTFNGGIGQAEPSAAPSAPGNPVFSMDARGQLLNYADDGRWAVTTGDATLAYRGQDPATGAWNPLLTNAVRTVAFQRNERVVVIYDWATSLNPKRWELNFQSLNAPTLSASTVKVQNGGASACIDVYGPAGTFAFTSGFPIPPETPMATQYQSRFVAATSSTELVSVTVVREACRAVPVTVNFTGTSASVSINGAAPLVADKKTVTVPGS
ncbi:MAG: heparinase II/III family protein [Burkholderiales bacterium]